MPHQRREVLAGREKGDHHVLKAQRQGGSSPILGQQLAAASFTGRMKQAWGLRNKRFLHSVRMSMAGKDPEPPIRRVFLAAASGGQRLLKNTYCFHPAQPLAPQIQMMLGFRED